ncbi:MAG TPA: hypothetical protein VF039_06680 [Longimicrobiales bacterium]
MIFPANARTPLCFAMQSSLRVETQPCSPACTRRCARNRRAITALLGATPQLGARAGLPTDVPETAHETTNPAWRLER